VKHPGAAAAAIALALTTLGAGQQDATLLSVPTAAGALASSRVINERAHYAGSPGDRALAAWMATQLAAAGLRTTIEPFTALVPQPTRLALEIMTHPVTRIDLRESAIAQDPDGSRRDAGIPFNAWSGSGTVTAPLVSAGRGLDADYRRLAAEHVDVRGKIVLVQYGAQFRGLLAARAQRHGAAAVILYSDPSGRDGSARGPAYPGGPYRPLGSVQRGSLSPGMHVPVLPVSALVERRLVRARVPIRVTVDERLVRKTLWNTIGILQGTDPHQEVILGGHRDAWVYGVTDNGDGISTLVETAKALGALARSGWRPKRTIIIAGWDGEELGELGSIAYVRSHFDTVRAQCVAYLNLDEGESGAFFEASAAAALAPFLRNLTRAVPDPAHRMQTLLRRWRAQPHGAVVFSPGGGSDFEAFLYDAGIPIADSGFAGPFGVYHSAFDDLRYATTEADPGFVNHRAMAQLYALAAARLAGEPLDHLYAIDAYAGTMRADLAAMPAPLAPDLAPFAAAITRFAEQAASTHAPDGVLLDAVHRLDALCYGRDGYAAVPLPAIASAQAAGAAAVRAAALASALQLDAITQELATPGA
jgi:N-acetylated-alpha-linked acidic dipeptidase